MENFTKRAEVDKFAISGRLFREEFELSPSVPMEGNDIQPKLYAMFLSGGVMFESMKAILEFVGFLHRLAIINRDI